MISQFSGEIGDSTLKDLHNFPKDVYPLGRLDKDSEGLLILTNDKKLNNKLLNPKFKHKRTYFAQVEGIPSKKAMQDLQKGIQIKTHFTLPCQAEIIPEPKNIQERNPPIRFRKNIPTTWVSMTLIEGKNRQVRRMLAKVGFPCLRLIRVSIENLSLKQMKIGDVMEISQINIYQKLKLNGIN